jgi:hypothetical protein
MSLGTLTIVESVIAPGPVFIDRVTLVGDGAYGAGGSTGLLAKLRAARKADNLDIISVKDEGILADACEYDHTNEKLLVRVKATGVESAVADQSAITYRLVITSKLPGIDTR